MWPGNRARLGEHFFPPTTSLGFLGRSPVCWSNNILEVIRNGGRETQHLERCVPGLVSGAQEPNNTIMQNIMKTFHRAMKIRKYLRLSKNSRMLSPVPGSLDSSPKPCVSFFFLRREAVIVHFRWDTGPLSPLTSKGHRHTASGLASPLTCCVTSGGSMNLSRPPSALPFTATDPVKKVVQVKGKSSLGK